jgi:hypothetical protein
MCRAVTPLYWPHFSASNDYVHDYYAMDNTKPQCVDVNVCPKGTQTVGNQPECPIQFSSI